HALCYLDLDQFKLVNDTCGHIAGDELLRQLATVLSTNIRDRDTLARLGGDEFGILLGECPLAKAQEIAEKICAIVKDFRFIWGDKAFELGASIGLVAINKLSENITNVMSAADTACYAAKDRGRNRVHVYQSDDAELQQRHGEMQWVPRLAQALSENRLRLYCQPIVPAQSNNEPGRHYEVLLRMLDENNQLVPPGAFLPAAERYNLMPTIDRWVIRETFAAYQKHARNNIDMQHDKCGINLSGSSLNDDQFLRFLHEQIDYWQIPSEVICFEITETVAIANLAKAVHFIKELKKRGCRFALDDFGSGLSSFAYLKNLPVDYLKIDGNFIVDIVDDPIDYAMVRSINEIGHVMGISTIAEYVENEMIAAKVCEIGVDFLQGYAISEPLPIDEFLQQRPHAGNQQRGQNGSKTTPIK
ncbi:MAG: EAL domain-containing protein, partial [Pseudomonadota bacterium]|nr:EAL domain-containing protein [Pseudomonadota bacterium]